ncbi:MAG: hypothetical protein SXU28_12170 [Pseudomonadota bacterium]|nr:hypothetical protein [Pseudomonadota bacterium]
MSFWTAMVIIVAIGVLGGVLRARYNAQAGIVEDMHGNQTIAPPEDRNRIAKDPEAQAEIAALKDRIAVLERIATDNNSSARRQSNDIAAEIEALRAATPRVSETSTQTTAKD